MPAQRVAAQTSRSRKPSVVTTKVAAAGTSPREHRRSASRFRFVADSALEGTGFELLVRGRGEAGYIQHSSPTGSSVMETAEHREPYESRGSRTDVCPEKAGMFSREQTCRGRSQSPVVWIAEEMETEPSKPIDKTSEGRLRVTGP